MGFIAFHPCRGKSVTLYIFSSSFFLNGGPRLFRISVTIKKKYVSRLCFRSVIYSPRCLHDILYFLTQNISNHQSTDKTLSLHFTRHIVSGIWRIMFYHYKWHLTSSLSWTESVYFSWFLYTPPKLWYKKNSHVGVEG